MVGEAWWAAVHGVEKSRTWLGDFTFTFHFYALEKEIATHSSVLAWRIAGMGSHRVGHDWSDLAESQQKEGNNKIEIKKMIEKVNKTKSWFFERVNKIDKPLARLIKKKREWTQINKLREGEISADTT